MAIADLDARRLEQVGRLYPVALKTTDHREIVGDASIDAVVVATPVSTHFPLGLEVLQAGKHLFIEKPMAASVEECQRLNDAADKLGRVIMVGHTSCSRRPCRRSATTSPTAAWARSSTSPSPA
ncbi:MAG: Gfo/Idh/MocA family oxidoreductase [Candidatus Krumholzibacteriia bacterium]